MRERYVAIQNPSVSDSKYSPSSLTWADESKLHTTGVGLSGSEAVDCRTFATFVDTDIRL